MFNILSRLKKYKDINFLKKDIEFENQNLDSNNILAKEISYIEKKGNVKFSDEDLLSILLLIDGKLIEYYTENKDYIYIVYIRYLYLLKEPINFIFQTLSELQTFYDLFIYFINENIVLDNISIVVENNLSTNKRKKQYQNKIVFIVIENFATDIIKNNYSKSLSDIIFNENKDFFDRKTVLYNITNITLFGDISYGYEKEFTEFDYSEYYKALKFLNVIEKDLYEIKNNSSACLTEKGIKIFEEIFNFVEINQDYISLLNIVEELIFVKNTFEIDVDYVIQNGEIVFVNKIHNLNLSFYLQLLNGLMLETKTRLVEKVHSNIIYTFFTTIQTISPVIQPYLDFMNNKFNFSFYSISNSFYKRSNNRTIVAYEEKNQVVNNNNILHFYNEKPEKIFFNEKTPNYVLKDFENLFKNTDLVLVRKEKNISFSQINEDIETSFSYNNLLYKKLFLFNQLKYKIVNMNSSVDLIGFFEKEYMRITDDCNIEDLINECLLNIDDDIMVNLIIIDLFEIINNKREDLYSEISILVSNIYYKQLNNQDPFALFEKQIYFLMENALKEVFLESLIVIRDKSKIKKKINIITECF